LFEVGVSLVVPEESPASSGGEDGRDGTIVSGYDEASGFKVPGRPSGVRASSLVIKGAEAVGAATDAIAAQIGLVAERIAAAIEKQALAVPEPGKLGLDSVGVSFGITLTVGVQAMFTAQAESSAQVSITLVRRPGTSS
jgi:hypothetical protein